MRSPLPRSVCECFVLLFLVSLCLLLPSSSRAQQPAEESKSELPTVAEIKEALAKPMVDDTKTQQDVEAFCEKRVLRLPAADAAERKSPEAWTKYIEGVRENVFREVVFRGEAAAWRDYVGKIEWQETIPGGEGYSIRKLRYEAVPGLWIPAILYEPAKRAGKTPVFLNVNGHDGAGKAAGYKQIRCINLAKRGILALNLEWMGMGQLRGPGFTHYKLNQLDLCGTSGVATHYLAMKRALDILLSQEGVDHTRVGIAGLSGGGWQTIFFSSLDSRITLSNPVAGYSSFLTRIQHYSDLGDSEQTPVNLAATGDYAHLTAMLAPRVALLTFNEKDNCCFAAPHALPPLMEATRPVYQLYGQPANLHEHVNFDPGTHNFERDNREALYKVIGQHWFAGDDKFSATEIECASEVKKAEELAVELPADNLDLQQLATQLMKDLPRGQATAEQIKQVLRIRSKRHVEFIWAATQQLAGTKFVSQDLVINREWRVPLFEFKQRGVDRVLLLMADQGGSTTAERVRQALSEKWNVIVIDPFYFGASKIKHKEFLFALLVSSVGERPLGVQVGQLQALAEVLHMDPSLKELRVAAIGPRTSLIALAAAATAPKAIDSVDLHGSLGSLKEVIEQGGSVDKTPEQFCFGLLETADIRDLAKLVVPRPLRFVEPSERVKKELSGLAGEYRAAGKEFDPLAP